MTSSDPLSDRQLWSDAAAGDRDAFGELFDRHGQAVYNHCFRLTGNWSQAEDATSAVFLAAWRRRADLTLVRDSALPWLLTVATHRVHDEHRSLRRRRALIARAGPPLDSPDHADAVAEKLDDERRMAVVLDATRQLPPSEREALVLCVWSGVSYADAAAVLGIAEPSVRSRVSRATSRLARMLGPQIETVPARAGKDRT
ncbi:RNA polymerase sigma factor [Cryptosporangium aurantiacum]|uniref:RNA polymerase, sigma subunit, ECF family n=1 Tax=Cryptosporangium aurantiacum TaxID=134849 RepID=A0A1M7PDI9_9ACTN|nr:RNA polymerase sigma factor [Cryptosporangium aurantiacum]SHN14989.1 RNA polymerase, sigma subunit, ECF family [Cryptosporangium aurantiacum]